MRASSAADACVVIAPFAGLAVPVAEVVGRAVVLLDTRVEVVVATAVLLSVVVDAGKAAVILLISGELVLVEVKFNEDQVYERSPPSLRIVTPF